MPTYDYACEACGHTFEQFQSITADPLKTCPKCSRRGLQRLIGAGAGVIFRGAGFYETDYRSESYKKAEEAEKKAATAAPDAKPGGDAAKSGDAKPAETKPAADGAKSDPTRNAPKNTNAAAKPAPDAPAKPSRSRSTGGAKRGARRRT